MDIIFASNNKGKIKEVQSLVSSTIKIMSMAECGIHADIPEPYFTFKENAWAKASYVNKETQKSCFAEDSGLVVPALNGEPGVLSARYAGVDTTDAKNNAKLLSAIQHVDDKRCYYQAVICLIINGAEYYFEGKCMGTITLTPRGNDGFGYDPLFIPDGYNQTFGELPLAEKNKISHRAEAMGKLLAFLNTY